MTYSPKPLGQEKVLLVAEYYPIGGTRTYVKQLLDFYHRMGASVTLVTTMSEPDPEIEKLSGDLGFTFLTYTDIVQLPKPSVWSSRCFAREKRKFRALAMTHSFTRVVVSAGTPGLLLGAVHAQPNGLYILHTYPHGRRQALLAGTFLSRRLPRHSQLVCVSQFQREVVENLWRTEQRGVQVATVVNTCGPEIVPTNDLPTQQPLQVITAAMVEHYKQPLQWIEIATQVSQQIGRDRVRFVWLGDGSLLETARRAAASVSHLADIRFPGRLESLESFYSTSHIYFQYSTIENMSIAVIDALRHGLPSVVTNVGALPEIVSDNLQGLLVSSSVKQEAISALQELIESSARRSELSISAKRRYFVKFRQELWDNAMLPLHQ